MAAALLGALMLLERRGRDGEGSLLLLATESAVWEWMLGCEAPRAVQEVVVLKQSESLSSS